VHRQIGAPFKQRHFKLFDEQAFATDFGQRAVKHTITLGGHAQDFNRALGIKLP